MASIAQFLEVDTLGLELVHAGDTDVDIVLVSTSELLDPTPYLSGGEFIVTSGSGLGPDDPGWRDYVARLSRSRVAGIGLALGSSHARVPRLLAEAASTYRVALLSIPAHTPYIALSVAVAALRRADTLHATRHALLSGQRILDRAFDGTGPAGIVSAVAAATGGQVAILERDGRSIAATAGFATPAPGEPTPSGQTSLDIGAGRRIVVDTTELTPDGRIGLTAGAIVLSIEERTRAQNTVVERERWGRVTRAFLTGDRRAAAYARLLDPDIELPHRVRVIAVQGQAEAIAAWRAEARTGTDRLVTRYPLGISELDWYDRRSPGTALAWQIVPGQDEASGGADDADERTSTRGNANMAAVGGSTEAIRETLDRISAHGLDAVIGREVPLADCASSRRSAAALLPDLSPAHQLYQVPRVPRRLWAEPGSLVLDRVLAAADAAALRDAILGPLAPDQNSDVRRTGDTTPLLPSDERAMLRDTLHAFLAHLGRLGPCATALGIHRNTLRGRLTRIEALLERSLDDADASADLWLALQLTHRTRG